MKRRRLSVDLDTKDNQDVKRMLERFEEHNPGVSTTWPVIEALRQFFTKKGYARKKDLAGKPEAAA